MVIVQTVDEVEGIEGAQHIAGLYAPSHVAEDRRHGPADVRAPCAAHKRFDAAVALVPAHGREGGHEIVRGKVSQVVRGKTGSGSAVDGAVT